MTSPSTPPTRRRRRSSARVAPPPASAPTPTWKDPAPGHDAIRTRTRPVSVRWDGHGVANDGRPYDNSYAWFMTVRDGKVIDGTAFFDSISFNDLWTRVPPQT